MSVKYSEDHEWISIEGDIGTVGITDHAQLPAQAKAYLKRIEEVTGVPIHMISTSPDRDHTILIRDPFQP